MALSEFEILKPIRHKGDLVRSGTVKLDADAHQELVYRGYITPLAAAESDDTKKAKGSK